MRFAGQQSGKTTRHGGCDPASFYAMDQVGPMGTVTTLRADRPAGMLGAYLASIDRPENRGTARRAFYE
jgi:hypothetical protein